MIAYIRFRAPIYHWSQRSRSNIRKICLTVVGKLLFIFYGGYSFLVKWLLIVQGTKKVSDHRHDFSQSSRSNILRPCLTARNKETPLSVLMDGVHIYSMMIIYGVPINVSDC